MKAFLLSFIFICFFFTCTYFGRPVKAAASRPSLGPRGGGSPDAGPSHASADLDLLLEMPKRLFFRHQSRVVAGEEGVDRGGDEEGEQGADRHPGEDGDADIEARDRSRAGGEDER